METYLSRIEAILNGEDIKPLSRVEELLKDYGGDGYDETYNTDEDKIKNDAFMLHKDTNFIFTEPGKSKTNSLLYSWDFTKSLSDEVQGKNVTLKKNATRDSEGVKFTGKGDRILIDSLPSGFFVNKVLEIDVASFDFKGSSSYGINFVCIPLNSSQTTACPLTWEPNVKWSFGVSSSNYVKYGNLNDISAINGKTVKLHFLQDKTILYLDDEYIGYTTYNIGTYATYAAIGSIERSSASNWDQSYNMTISGVRIYINNDDPYPDKGFLNWDFTNSLEDEVMNLPSYLKRKASRTDNGVELTHIGDYLKIDLPSKDYLIDKTLEIEVSKFDFKGNESYGMNFTTKQRNSDNYAQGPLQYSVAENRWCFTTTSSSKEFYDLYGRNALNGKTIKLVFTSADTTLYLDDVNYGTVNAVIFTYSKFITIGARDSSYGTNNDQTYDCTIKSIKIYPNN